MTAYKSIQSERPDDLEDLKSKKLVLIFGCMHSSQLKKADDDS